MSDSSLLDNITSAIRPGQRPIDRLLRPIEAFAHHRLAGAGLLMLATIVAIVWANSPWSETYEHVLHLEAGFDFDGIGFQKSVHHWINDGLMGVFFFLVGLEIKRELLVGELSTFRKATLPAVAAAGGMVVPAMIYYAINGDGPGAHGWGVPMATDIAFALGVLALLGDRVPLGLKVFLTALAIVDDIGAVVVIAVFYTDDLAFLALGAGLVFLGCSIALNLAGARNPVSYLFFGTCTWLCFLESGVHATIAALLMAFTIPARTAIDGSDFVSRMEILLERLKEVGVPSDRSMNDNMQQVIFEKMNETVDHASAPLQRIEHALAGPSTFFVLPLFALANAGVTIHGGVFEEIANPIPLGIILGLFVGKTIGITATSWVAVKLGLADLPKRVTWPQVVGVAMLGGIGFTMALFVSALAFDDPAQIESAKLGILTGSIISGVLGFLIVRASCKAPSEPAEGDGGIPF
jgi:NhaA family Na+:H+ antiporter